MVSGKYIRVIMDYVTKKKGVEGLKKLINEANEKKLMFTSEKDIIPGKNYPISYLAKIIDSAISVLDDKNLIREMGTMFGEEMEIKFEGLFGKYPPKKSVQKMVVAMRKSLPMFHTGYRTLSENTYWLIVSKIKKSHISFVDGVVTKLFERHGKITDVKKKISTGKIEYTVKF